MLPSGSSDWLDGAIPISSRKTARDMEYISLCQTARDREYISLCQTARDREYILKVLNAALLHFGIHYQYHLSHLTGSTVLYPSHLEREQGIGNTLIYVRKEMIGYMLFCVIQGG